MMKSQSSNRKLVMDNALSQQVGRLVTAGLPVALDPEDAEVMGAERDDALDADAAFDSRMDHLAPTA